MDIIVRKSVSKNCTDFQFEYTVAKYYLPTANLSQDQVPRDVDRECQAARLLKEAKSERISETGPRTSIGFCGVLNRTLRLERKKIEDPTRT